MTRLVGDEVTPVHKVLGALACRRACRHLGAEQVAGRDVGQPEALHDELALRRRTAECAATGPGCVLRSAGRTCVPLPLAGAPAMMTLSGPLALHTHRAPLRAAPPRHA